MTVSGDESDSGVRVKVVKEQKFWHNVRKYFREHNDVTGIHGLRYLSEKRSRTEKVIWAIILLGSLVGCVYMIYEIVEKYESSPVVVSFATRDMPIYEIPFPAVTICPEAKCAREKFSYSDVYRNYVTLNKTLTEQELQYFEYISLLCNIDESDKFMENSNKTVVDNDFLKVMDTLKSNVIMYCNFMGSEFECEDILTPIITDAGICYSFNLVDRRELFRDHIDHYGKFHNVGRTSQFDGEHGYHDDADVETYPKRALMSGADNSLDIYILSPRADNDYICNTFYQGYRVLIHNPLDVPQLSKEYFRIPFDKVLVTAVQPELVVTSDAVRNFKPEKRKCYINTERPLKHFKVYTQSNCLLECVTNHTLSKCGCVSFYMPRDSGTAICGIGSDECVSKAKNEMKLQELRNKISKKSKTKSTCDCQPLCTSLKYNVEISQSDFKWKEYFEVNDAINIPIETNEMEYTISVLSIYFRSEQFITLERNELYGVSDLVSNFGGLVGLFTGFSLITMAEIIYFLTLRIFCNNRLYGLWSGSSG